jgi:hypothetical protein
MIAVAIGPDGMERWRIPNGFYQEVADNQGIVWFNSFINPFWSGKVALPIIGTLMKVSSAGELEWLIRFKPANQFPYDALPSENGETINLTIGSQGTSSGYPTLYSVTLDVSGAVVGGNWPGGEVFQWGIRGFVSADILPPGNPDLPEAEKAHVLELYEQIDAWARIAEASEGLQLAPIELTGGMDAYTDGTKIFIGRDLARIVSTASLRDILVHEQTHILNQEVEQTSLLAEMVREGVITEEAAMKLRHEMELNGDGAAAFLAALEGRDVGLADFLAGSEADEDHPDGNTRAAFIQSVYLGVLEGVSALCKELGITASDVSAYASDGVHGALDAEPQHEVDQAAQHGFPSLFGELLEEDIDVFVDPFDATAFGWEDWADFTDDFGTVLGEDDSVDWTDGDWSDEWDGGYEDGGGYEGGGDGEDEGDSP